MPETQQPGSGRNGLAEDDQCDKAYDRGPVRSGIGSDRGDRGGIQDRMYEHPAPDRDTPGPEPVFWRHIQGMYPSHCGSADAQLCNCGRKYLQPLRFFRHSYMHDGSGHLCGALPRRDHAVVRVCKKTGAQG